MPCGNVFNRWKRKRCKKKSSVSSTNQNFARPSSARSRRSSEDGRVSRRKDQETQTLKNENNQARKKSGEIEYLPSPTKSPTDKKEYTVIRLPNGITATIISESEGIEKPASTPQRETPNQTSEIAANTNGSEKLVTLSSKVNPAEKNSSHSGKWLERDFSMTVTHEGLAACAVTVKVGSFNDPDEIPGLCHLLEHVVSMGSDKYPDENQFDAHLAAFGGSQDARTECEYTTFHVECREKHLHKTMDMFARFFIAPLLKWDTVKKERNVVDSEFAEHVHSDNARRMRLIADCADNVSPAKKFTWGNLQTLQDNIGSEKLLKALGSFRYQYFVGRKMFIAVQARKATEQLQAWVEECFSEVIAETAHRVRFSQSEGEPFDMAKFSQLYRVQSISDISELNINWVLPPMINKYKTKPLEYLSYVIGAEGEGSLISYMRKQRMALFLTAEVEDGGICSNSLYTIFTICVSLTDEGRDKINDIVTTVFGYLSLLRASKSSEDVYNELKNLADTNFRFSQGHSAVDNVTTISQNMTMFPPEDYLTGWALFFDYSPEDIEMYLSKMTPDRANILVHTKNHEVELNREEPWFKTKYRVDHVPEEWLTAWRQAVPDPNFCLPKPNPYVTTDFSLVSHIKELEHPEKLVETEVYEVWHKGCNIINRIPVASVNILINIPSVSKSAKNTICQMIITKMLTYQMIEDLYFAHVAQLEVQITTIEYGIEICIYGFSQRLHEILKTVAQGLKGFKDKAEEQEHMLEYLKTVYQRNMSNVLFDGEKLLEDIRKSVLSNITFTSAEKYSKIKDITMEEMMKYWDGLFEDVYVHALIEGNILADEAGTMVREFVDILNLKSGKLCKSVKPSVKEIPKGENIMSIAAFHPDDGNIYTQFYYQHGPAKIDEVVALQLYVAMMREPLFDELRTKEQLGYSVSASISEIYGVLGVLITVNSQISRFTPESIRARIDSFVQSYMWYFKTMSPHDYAETKTAFVTLKRIQAPDLREDSSRDWWEIKNRHYEFDRRIKEIEALQRLDKKTAYDVVEKVFHERKYGGNKLVMQVVGYKSKGDQTVKESSIEGGKVIYQYVDTQVQIPTKVVKDIARWKTTLREYPGK